VQRGEQRRYLLADKCNLVSERDNKKLRNKGFRQKSFAPLSFWVASLFVVRYFFVENTFHDKTYFKTINVLFAFNFKKDSLILVLARTTI